MGYTSVTMVPMMATGSGVSCVESRVEREYPLSRELEQKLLIIRAGAGGYEGSEVVVKGCQGSRSSTCSKWAFRGILYGLISTNQVNIW